MGAPLQFVPHEFCPWQHRFDDPEQQYRTLYCAEHPVTSLREVLADLHPNAMARALRSVQSAQGVPEEKVYRPAGEVRLAWREQHVLAPATVSRNGPLANLDDPALRERLAESHAALLAKYGLDHLNISEIRSKTRIVTQTIGRDLYERGAAGLRFRSNLDGRRCIVLFEGRAELQPDGNLIPLTGEVAELLTVCGEYGLILRGTPAPAEQERAWRP